MSLNTPKKEIEAIFDASHTHCQIGIDKLCIFSYWPQNKDKKRYDRNQQKINHRPV